MVGARRDFGVAASASGGIFAGAVDAGNGNETTRVVRALAYCSTTSTCLSPFGPRVA